MNTVIDTVVVAHVPNEWRTTHRRWAFLALAETLPANAAVLCVNRPVDPVVTLLKHPRKFWRGVWTTRFEAERDRLAVVTPRLILHEQLASRVPAVTAVNRRCLAAQLRQVLENNFPCARRVIQWIHHPSQRWVFDAIPECGKVYHCYDEYTCTVDGVFHPDRWIKEQAVLQEADVTFVTSPSLMKRRQPVARRCCLLPNGVPDFFLQPGDTPFDPLDELPPPRMLYFGTMYTFLDYAMLKTVFGRRPDWQLVMIGPLRNLPEIRELRRLPNVHFMGFRTLEVLRGIMNRFSVALMPYKVNQYSIPLTPLKLYIYLAAGMPVVSTSLPDLQPLGSVIRLVEDDAQAFETGIEDSLREDQTLVAAGRQAEGSRHTWTVINRERVVPILRATFGF